MFNGEYIEGVESLEHLSLTLFSSHQHRPFLVDITWLANGKKKPIVIFAHGFKGFKDWGPFPSMASYFAENGFVFLKFNFSHNGTTVEDPLNFADLRAFGQDNHSIQLDDLGTVIDSLENGTIPLSTDEMDLQTLFLVGHSRGGSMALLKAAEDTRIQKVVTWAAVSDLTCAYSSQEVQTWKESGVLWIPNARTHQQMPVYYQYYEDLIRHKERLEILKVVRSITQPLLLLHGTNDTSVVPDNAYSLHKQVSHSQLELIEGATHTFGSGHPYFLGTFPEHFKLVVDKTIVFLK